MNRNLIIAAVMTSVLGASYSTYYVRSNGELPAASSIYDSMRSFSCSYEANTQRLRFAWTQNEPKVDGSFDRPHITSAIYVTFEPIPNPRLLQGPVVVRDESEQNQLQIEIGNELLTADAIKAVEFRNRTEFPRGLVPDERRGIKREITAFLLQCLREPIDRRGI